MDKFSDIKYIRPDIGTISKEFKIGLKNFKNAKSYDEAKKSYLDIEVISSEVQTMFTVAHIRSDMDKADRYYESEVRFMNGAMPKLMLLVQKAGKALLDSPYKADFENEYGMQLIRLTEAAQKTISWKIIPEMIKEGNIQQEYSKTAASCKVVFRGAECNFYGLLNHMESTDREERKEAFIAWAKLYEGISDKLDRQYDKFVSLRTAMARKLKFPGYIEMVYMQKDRFNYSAGDVEKFREQVKKHIVPVCVKLHDMQAKRLGIDKLKYYDEKLVFKEGNAIPHGSKDEMVRAAQTMYRELSKETGEFFDFMCSHELFDLETRPNKHLGGYCTFLPVYYAPFIFSNFNGTSADVDVLTHEAGHAFEAFMASKSQPIMEYWGSTSEINEIHSMTMEHFTYPWMDRFFRDKADKYRFGHLSDAFMSIPYIVCVDDFQHKVFEDPKRMKAKQRRELWHSLEKEYMPWRDYDSNEFLEGGGFWMQKQHIFLYPFYYIDYALAQICAFELYGRMQNDKNAAWNDYLDLCKAGGSKGYFELLEIAHLHNPFIDGSVEAAVKFVTEELERSGF
ncbi:MAG: M3 family oligoendopeptidase [Clostridia bacterium]|jgi:M3 family oligoendopeptidase